LELIVREIQTAINNNMWGYNYRSIPNEFLLIKY
jgi:hypothetical protein